eukprot:gene10056-13516_t
MSGLYFDLKECKEYVDFQNRFHICHVAYNTQNTLLAIASEKYLLILHSHTNDTLLLSAPNNVNNSRAALTSLINSTIRLVLQFQQDAGRSTCLCWINEYILCIGFEVGLIVCFTCDGENIFEYIGNKSSVQSIKKNLHYSNNDTTTMPEGIWVLYEDGLLALISTNQIIRGEQSDIMAFRFADHHQLNDFVFLHQLYSLSPFDFEVDATYSLLVGGMDSALSVYNLGSQLHFQDFSKLAGYVKEKVNSLITKSYMTIFSLVGSITASETSSSKTDDSQNVAEKSVTLSSMVDFKDAKRRILRLSIDPNGSLVAAADSLGRVTLFDTQIYCIIRILKGLRDARLAWVTNQSIGFALHLTIYAPQLGLVSIYQMKNGPCQRIIPVGLNCHIFSIMEKSLENLKSCKSMLLRPLFSEDSSTSILELSEIDPVHSSSTDIDKTKESVIFIGEDDEESQQAVVEALNLPNNNLTTQLDANENNEYSIITNVYKLLNNITYSSLANTTGRPSSVNSNNRDSFSNNINSHYNSDLIGSVETSIIDLLTQNVDNISISGLVKCMSLIENIELTGELPPLLSKSKTKVSNQHNVSNLQSSTLNTANLISFSIRFHKNLNEIILNSIEKEIPFLPIEDKNDQSVKFIDTAEINKIIITELNMRKSLIMAYESLYELNDSSTWKNDNMNIISRTRSGSNNIRTSPVPFANNNSNFNDLSAANNEELIAISGLNTYRAEAICWILRLIKKTDKIRSKFPNSSSNGEANGSTGLPRNSGSSGSLNTTLNNNSRNSKKFLSSSAFNVITKDHNASRISNHSSPYNTAQSSPRKLSFDDSNLSSIGIQSQSILNFSVFRIFHMKMKDELNNNSESMIFGIGSINFRTDDLLYLQSKNNNTMKEKLEDVDSFISIQHIIDQLLPNANANAIEKDKNKHMDISNELFYDNSSCDVYIQRVVIMQLLSFIIAPLIGDLFALNSYISTTKMMGLTSGIVIQKLLPLLLLFLQNQPMSVLISEIMIKALSTSPFQRWLRDNLLTFQDSIASNPMDLLSLNGSSSELDSDDDPEAVDDNNRAYGRSRDSSIGDSNEIASIHKLAREIMNNRSLGGEENDNALIYPSFDEFVRHILYPAYRHASQSLQLETAMAFVAIVIDTLQAVNDQVERRTYGDSNLKNTISEWESLHKKLRVVLLLSSRIGFNNFNLSVDSLSNNTECSLYRLLALDTLEFAIKAENAIEHEEKCQEVYRNRIATNNNNLNRSNKTSTSSDSLNNRMSMSSTSATATSSKHHMDAVLLGWGESADKRWRDLMQVAICEDNIEYETIMATIVKNSNIDSPAGSTLALLKSPSSPMKPINLSSPSIYDNQLKGHPLNSSPSPVSNVLPSSPQVHIPLTATSSHGNLPKSLRKRKPLLLYFPHHYSPHLLGCYRSLALTERWLKYPFNLEILSLANAHLFFIDEAWRAVASLQIYNYYLFPFIQSLLMLEEDPTDFHIQSNQSSISSSTSPLNLLYQSKDPLYSIMNHKDYYQFLSFVSSDMSHLILFVRIVVDILHFIAVSPQALQDEEHSATIATSLQPPSQHNNTIWFQCGLRGIKPSLILSEMDIKPIRSDLYDNNDNNKSFQKSPPIKNNSALQLIRYEFIDQCLKRLYSIQSNNNNNIDNNTNHDPNQNSSSNIENINNNVNNNQNENLLYENMAFFITIIYQLGDLWGLSKDMIKLLHIITVLHFNLDDDAEQLITQVSDSNLMFDTLSTILRMRLGNVISRIDRVPAYGPLLASMDSEVVAWVKKAIISTENNPGILRKDKPTNINLTSTRHLVLILKGYLLAVPLHERDRVERMNRGIYNSSHAATDEFKVLLRSMGAIGLPVGSVSDTWNERNTKCDALLSICESLKQKNPNRR